MRAWAYDRYGELDVVTLHEVADPLPARGELLVRVRAAAINPKDNYFRRGLYRYLSGSRFPKLLGCDFAGEVAALGTGVTGLSEGQRVWGHLDEVRYGRGTLATFVRVKAGECAPMPPALSFEDAASISLAAQTSLQALRNIANLQPGELALIHGASGGVGVFAVQVAKALGARVTTTSSRRNFELCRSLGADETLDYAGDAPFRRGPVYDVIFDAVGNRSLSRVRAVLSPRGRYVTTVPLGRFWVDRALTTITKPTARLILVRSRTEDLNLLASWIASERLRPVVDRVYPFEEAPEALAYVETRRARGKVVVRVD